MAATTSAAQLTELHRQAQLALRAALVTDVLRLWPMFDVDDIGASWAALEPALLAMVLAYGNMSAGLAGGYYEEFRSAEGIAGVPTPRMAGPASADELVGTLRLVGPTSARQLAAAGRTDVIEVTFSNVAGETSRQVLNQGRGTIEESVAADAKALGWSRVTDSKPCAFCRMLAGRGPVYRSQKAGAFRAHGHCGCSLEPVYDRDAPWPGQAREFHDEWKQVTKGLSGADARLAYRQHVEGRGRDGHQH